MDDIDQEIENWTEEQWSELERLANNLIKSLIIMNKNIEVADLMAYLKSLEFSFNSHREKEDLISFTRGALAAIELIKIHFQDEKTYKTIAFLDSINNLR